MTTKIATIKNKGSENGLRTIEVQIHEKELEKMMEDRHYGSINDGSSWLGYGLRDWLQDN